MKKRARAGATKTGTGTRPSAKRTSAASARAGLVAHFEKRHAATAKLVEAGLRSAWKKLLRQTAGEHPYAFALYTSGQDSFSYVTVSACTEEGLTHVAETYLARHPTRALETERASLRWNASDWSHHAFADVKRLGIDAHLAIRTRWEDAAIWEAFATALERCDASGLFGRGATRERITLAILCGDMGSRFFAKGVRRLNPPLVVSRTLREWRQGLAAFDAS